MKKKLLYLILLFASIHLSAQITITESSGWLESAFVKWTPLSGADSYNVYYTGGGQTNKKIDNELIRNYGSYFRADIPGIAAGSYTITIKPVTAGTEGTGATTASLTVKAHDRSGFAFNAGRVPGAYNADGTPKSNAVIIYITQKTKNTVSLNVTGASSNPCVGLQTILDGFKKGKDTRPLIIRMIGQITDLSYMLNGDLVIENNNNAASYITLEGIGNDATADGWGIRVKNASNIEIRNIGIMNCDSGEGDNIGLQQDNDYVWVHNCDFFYGKPGSDADQIKGDGALDCKKSTYVTFSYNHFWDNGKSNLLGLSEGTTEGLYITYHHNWYDHSDSRHPRIRYYSAHVYNNYYDGNSKYGVGSTLGSSVFVEANFFRNCKYPMLTSMQGTDIYNGAGTFSSEDGGTIKAFNNTMSGQNRFVGYDATTYPVEFDAYVAATRNETISSSIKSKKGAKTYNNFDTNTSVMYAYTPETPENAKTTVMQYAGRISGGDFQWTFNNTIDDTADGVNIGLRDALYAYQTSLVNVQGETPSASNPQTLTTETDNNQTVSAGTAIEPMIFTWGGDATDATVTGLPASGISFVKNTTAKTITITGTPTANVSFSIATSGTSGSPANATGTITVEGTVTPPAGDQIHNFTESGTTSTFYTISGNLATNKGTVTYNGLTLTQCLKLETATSITYTTTQSSTLTLVLVEAAGTAKIDGTNYTATAGIITVTLPAGNHTIAKKDTANLFYMKTAYSGTLKVDKNSGPENLVVYPNPIVNQMYITSDNVQKVEVYNILGSLVKTVEKNTESIDMSHLTSGHYIVKIKTDQGTITKKIIKK
ncbi:pectate lyase [Flavobacterium crocinum]|uniref:Pectate lyase n=1 Tax=Flavobacterium crocinum TaxID=2183896 RepID=A0A2S1YIF2_9FLAO|nr:T9SS type A sorting domain-containing protein [Flavobacterium crocinum]AWK03841.1 pectate lyase [Flavobacterium crocinum]